MTETLPPLKTAPECAVPEIVSHPPRCQGCRAIAPDDVDTRYTLIARGWRLSRRATPGCIATVDWWCERCWEKNKRALSATTA